MDNQIFKERQLYEYFGHITRRNDSKVGEIFYLLNILWTTISHTKTRRENTERHNHPEKHNFRWLILKAGALGFPCFKCLQFIVEQVQSDVIYQQIFRFNQICNPVFINLCIDSMLQHVREKGGDSRANGGVLTHEPSGVGEVIIDGFD